MTLLIKLSYDEVLSIVIVMKMKFFKIGKIITKRRADCDPLNDSTNHTFQTKAVSYVSSQRRKQSSTKDRREFFEDLKNGNKLSFNSSLDAATKKLNEEESISSSIQSKCSATTKLRLIEGLKKGGQSSRFSTCNSWKWAIDKQTQRRYFYNKETKEVTWVKPEEYNEWKIYSDRSTHRCYYYNTYTGETTWEQPKDLVVDHPSCEDNSLVATYTDDKDQEGIIDTDIMTREDSMKGDHVSENHSGSKEIEEIHTKDFITEQIDAANKSSNCSVIKPDPWKAYFDYAIGKHFFYNFITKEKTWTKPKDFQEWIAVESSSDKELYYYNVLTGISSWLNPSLMADTASKAELQDITMKYSPDEVYDTQRFFRKFQGRENIPIQAIQSYTKGNEPFDEKNLAVTSVVKAAVTPIGREPYDEMVDSSDSSYKSRFSNTLSTTRIPYDFKTAETNATAEKVCASSPSFSRKSSQMSSTSAYSRYLSKPIHIVGSSGRTATYMYR